VVRRVSTFVSIVMLALFASSAAAVPSTGEAPMPGKRELQRAGKLLLGKSFSSSDRRSLDPVSVRRLALRGRAQTPQRPTSRRRSGLALSALESGVLAHVNAVRRNRGLRALTISRGLSAAAAHHSRQMVQHGFFEHESRGGGSFWRRVERFYGSGGFRSWEVGENLAYGSPDLDAAATVRMWMNSPGHRDNLLARTWREIGLGALHAASAGGEFGGSPVTIVTADFGLRVR
jgi:uncharacterized protein YkwD